MPRRTHALRRSLRGSARRATAAAATRYRAAVLDRSRWLPAYLAAVDAADGTMRAARVARRRPVAVGPWDEPDTAVTTIVRAELSAAGELSLVLTGPAAELDSVHGVELEFGDGRAELPGALLDRTGDWLRVCAPLPHDLPAARRHGVPTAMRLDTENGALVLLSGPDDHHLDPTTIEHRTSTGIARLTVEWTPPSGSADELLLLGADGAIVARVAGAAAGGEFALSATIDTVPAGDAVLTVAVHGPDSPVPLVLARGTYPPLLAAPPHGSARLGAARVQAGYDSANRLQLRVQT